MKKVSLVIVVYLLMIVNIVANSVAVRKAAIETIIEITTAVTIETTTEATTETTTVATITEATTVLPYQDYELELMAHLIYGEAGDQDDECQRAVGSVVMNRVNHEGYPNSIKEVIYQPRQYACTWDGNFDKEPSEQAYRNAKWILEGNNMLPTDVIYQSQFEQGSGVYRIIGSEVFCFE